MKILGIDPGGTTGVVLVDIDFPTATVEIMFAGHVRLWDSLDNIIASKAMRKVIMERYILRNLGADNEPPIKVIGVVEYLCQLHDMELLLRTPQSRLVIDKRFPGLLKPHKLGVHAGSAIRHVLTYVYVNNGISNFTLKSDIATTVAK